MRYGLLALGLAACVGLHRGWLAPAYDDATSAALTADAQLAIDLRCRGSTHRAARECRRMLKRIYLSGSLDPDKTLRTYCDSVRTAQWGGGFAAPPEVCIERYGGWQQG